MIKELIKLANELDRKGLTKEADCLDKLIKRAFDSAKDIISKLTDNFEKEDADELFEKWYNMLKNTDLVDGLGSFPLDHMGGPSFMKNFIKKYWDNKRSMTVDEFEEAAEKHFGQSPMGVIQYGWDNEDGWVESYNSILRLWTAKKRRDQ